MGKDILTTLMKENNTLYKEGYKKLNKKNNKTKKRKTLSASAKIIIWENNPHICHICRKKILKLSETEFDHVKAFSKGGTKLKLSHKLCNRVKSDKSLKSIRHVLGIKK